MRIIFNQNFINDINDLISDPAVYEALSFWGNNDIYEKSSVDLSKFLTPFGSISLLYGPRQIGKTASLKLFLSQLRDSETIIFTDCSTILDRSDLYRHLSGLIVEGTKTTIVLDEVQEVPAWHLALRTLYSEGKIGNCRIWCTGSEARYLIESGERLPGRRGEGRNLFARPWSFREYMDFFYPTEAEPYRAVNFKHVNQIWLDAQQVDWGRPWQSYLMSGGIPRAVGCTLKRGEIPDHVWRVYIDWILGSWSSQRTAERSLASLAHRLIDTMTSRVGFETLKKGTDIQSANTIKSLLETQEDHFSIRVLPRYDLQKGVHLPSKLKKIYPLDPFIARIWAAIGWNVRRVFKEGLPVLSLDECAFQTQMLRSEEPSEASYLYSEATQSEIDFYFRSCGFELKSNGQPTKKQKEMLRACPQAFVVRKEKLPLMAYLIGEGRDKLSIAAPTPRPI